MKFIKTIVDRINLLNRKGLSPYYSPDQIVEEVHSSSMNLWKKYIAEFERTQLISVYLDPFRLKETVALTSGAGTIVTTKGQYRTAVMLPSSDVQVTIVDIGHWSKRANDSIRIPDALNPICRIDNGAMKVLPVTIASVDVYALKTPLKPVYAFTVVDDDYVYDDTTSVDFEWPEILHDEITHRVFSSLGLSQRESNLIQYSNTEIQKEGK